MSQQVYPSLLITYSLMAENADSTEDTLPEMMSVPVNLSTKPISAPEDLIAMSAAMTALSAGDMVSTPIAERV